MSTSSTPLTPALNEYITTAFSAEDDFLRSLNDEAVAEGIPPISIAPEQTAFLQVLLRAISATTVLEIGSLAGYSAIAMARVLPEDGNLYACEFEPIHAEFIRKKVDQAGLSKIISVVEGAALDTIPGILASSPELDVVFIDADKQNYPNYFELVFPHIRSGGLIIGDNALAWGQVHMPDPDSEADNVKALRAFNDLLQNHPDIQSTLVPLGDGMVVGIKR